MSCFLSCSLSERRVLISTSRSSTSWSRLLRRALFSFCAEKQHNMTKAWWTDCNPCLLKAMVAAAHSVSCSLSVQKNNTTWPICLTMRPHSCLLLVMTQTAVYNLVLFWSQTHPQWLWSRCLTSRLYPCLLQVMTTWTPCTHFNNISFIPPKGSSTRWLIKTEL